MNIYYIRIKIEEAATRINIYEKKFFIEFFHLFYNFNNHKIV